MAAMDFSGCWLRSLLPAKTLPESTGAKSIDRQRAVKPEKQISKSQSNDPRALQSQKKLYFSGDFPNLLHHHSDQPKEKHDKLGLLDNDSLVDLVLDVLPEEQKSDRNVENYRHLQFHSHSGQYHFLILQVAIHELQIVRRETLKNGSGTAHILAVKFDWLD